MVAITLRSKLGDGSNFWDDKNAEVEFALKENQNV